MASAAIPEEEKTQTDRWRERAMLGNLPPDFLTVTLTTEQQQMNNDHMTALAMQYRRRTPAPKLTINVAMARLTKNYGFLATRMDPYVRLTVGQVVYETRTHVNGARNPRWNQVVRCAVHHGLESINVEVYDERNFSQDELIAWANIPIPMERLQQGEVVDDWYALSGKQGEGQEGMINLGFQYGAEPDMATHVPVLLGGPAPMVVYPSVYPPQQPYYGVDPRQPRVMVDPTPITQAMPPTALSDADVKEFQDMFPSLDEEIIRSVYSSQRGNKESTVNALLELGST